MALNFNALLEGYKKKLSQVGGFLSQNPTPASFIKNKLNPPISPLAQPPQNTLSNRAMVSLSNSSVGKGIVGLQKKIETRTLPRVNLQQYTQNIKAPVPRIGAQLGAGVAENLINLPQRLLEGGGKAGLDIRTLQSGGKITPARAIGTAASIADPLLDIATLGGGTVAKNIAKQGGKQIAKQSLKQAVKTGALKGVGAGALYGGLYGLSEGDEAQLGNLLRGAGIGAALGGTIGGASAGLGGIVGKLAEAYKKHHPNASPKEITKGLRTFIQDETTGKLLGSKKKAPEFYGDLRESVGLDRKGDYSMPVGLQAKPKGGNKAILEAEALSSRTGSYIDPQGKKVAPNTTVSPQQLKSGVSTPTTTNQEASLNTIIDEKGKLNLDRLNVDGEGKKVLQNIQKEVKATVIGNKEVIAQSRTATGNKRPMTDEQMKKLLANQLKNRQVVTDLTKKFNEAKARGADEIELGKIMLEMAGQSRVAQQGGTFAGRLLQAQNIIANESAGPMQKVLALLNNAGVKEERYLKDAVKVNWDNSSDVVSFYRKYVPAGFGEVLDEIRYSNMLSSPLTHITNIVSNAIQTAVVAPVEKTITGALDFGKTVLTGKERQYYASAGIDYAGGYVASLPKAFNKAWGVLSGKDITVKPDFERIPTNKFKLYNTPLRALEAMDQFFKTLVEGGVSRELRRGPQNLGMDKIADTASNEANYRLFRQAFDPSGELGQGGVLKLWDNWNSAIQNLRRVPGGNWVLPFLQTPTNILKQGVEFSPLGAATIPGAKRPIEQLSKTIIGTGVFAGAYQLGAQGLLSWDAPTTEKERDLYYAAGLQPYSVKIGDKWVSFSKLGPLSYPIAMASALANAERKNPNQSQTENIGSAVGGMLKFFGDQSYVRSIGDLVEAIQGGGNISSTAFKSEAANLIGQMIPYKSFLTWIGRTIDPVYRKANSIPERLIKDLPIVGSQLEPYTDPMGNPSQKDFPLLNAISPYKMTQEKGANEELYRKYEGQKVVNAQIREAQDLVKEAKGSEQVGETIVFWDEKKGEVRTIDLSFQPELPTITGLDEIDKESISRFKSDITKKINDLYDLSQAGHITPEQANEEIKKLTELKTSIGGGKGKGKKKAKPSIKKVSMRKVSTPKIQKIKIAAPRFRKIKNYTVSVPKIQKSTITQTKLDKWTPKTETKFTRVK